MKLFLFKILVLTFSTVIYAHSGRTDKYGGHHDRKNGGYHYHHGKSAHDHKNGKCPYRSKASLSLVVIALGGLAYMGYKKSK